MNRYSPATPAADKNCSIDRPTASGRAARSAGLALCLFIGACAQSPHHPGSIDRQTEDCRQRFLELDRRIDAAAVRDPVSHRIPGFPYLRSNRFLASFADEVDADTLPDWLARLAALDERARRFELANLPPTTMPKKRRDVHTGLALCRQRLIAADLRQPRRLDELRRAARVPDDYQGWQRLLGLYPITALFVSARINSLQRDLRAAFIQPDQTITPSPDSRYWSQRTGTTTPASRVLPVDRLGIPRASADTLATLLTEHAPVWAIDQGTADDNRPGQIRWRQGRVISDTQRPTVYQWVSHTRFQQKSLLQLNYLIWFPRRSGDDIYAGHLDGLIWRVTLGPDGRPWLYDSIHSCGCYHTFFPTPALRPRPPPEYGYRQAPFLPRRQAVREQALLLRISAGKHYIYAVTGLGDDDRWQRLAVLDYDRLRSLADEQGRHRGIFMADGLIPGTERAERFLLWPMGIRSAGAMRSIGRQATAFIGRQHFDDARLIETWFEASATGPSP